MENCERLKCLGFLCEGIKKMEIYAGHDRGFFYDFNGLQWQVGVEFMEVLIAW